MILLLQTFSECNASPLQRLQGRLSIWLGHCDDDDDDDEYFDDYDDFYDHGNTDDDNYDYFDVVAGVITNFQLDEETLRDILTKVFPSGGRSLFTFTFLFITYVIHICNICIYVIYV